MDAFFAAVEQLDNVQLKGKPVIVGGNPQKRGVVAACSYEARQFGIHSAMPSSKAVRLCPHAIFVRPRMMRYKEISDQVMTIFSRFTEVIEPLSLDEAYLDVTVNKLENPSATRLAECIRHQISSTTGLTASAGVSYNKFLAKIASEVNKPNGLHVILPEDAISFLDTLPVGKFHGIGRVTEKKMGTLGIRFGRDLRQFSKEDLILHFGKSGAFFFEIVRGRDDRLVLASRERKSIGSETTLEEDTSDTEEVTEILHHLAEKIETVLRQKECGGSTITLKVRYYDFSTITRSTTLRSPVFKAPEILNQVHRLIRSTAVGAKKIRLLGISISKLVDKNENRPVQLLLPFDE
jgi:DNA polymerase-4